MVRQSPNSSVRNIDVTVERPEDRDTEKDYGVGGDDGTLSISGSGGSTTLATNSSDGDWRVDHVSVHARGGSAAVGAVTIEVQIRDSDDNMKVAGIADGATGGVIPFRGKKLKPDDDIHVTVSQADANSYTIVAKPYIRKPDPSETSSGGGGGGGSDTVTVYEDFERSSPLSDYSGSTTNFTVSTTQPYHDSNSLDYDTSTTGSNHGVWTSKDSKPEDPFVARWYIRSDTSEGDGTTAGPKMAAMFGVSDANNGLRAEFRPHVSEFILNEVDAGSTNLIDTDSSAYDYPGDEWLYIKIDYDSTRNPSIKASLHAKDGTQLSSLEGSASLPGSAFGFLGRKSSSGTTHHYDYVRDD